MQATSGGHGAGAWLLWQTGGGGTQGPRWWVSLGHPLPPGPDKTSGHEPQRHYRLKHTARAKQPTWGAFGRPSRRRGPHPPQLPQAPPGGRPGPHLGGAQAVRGHRRDVRQQRAAPRPPVRGGADGAGRGPARHGDCHGPKRGCRAADRSSAARLSEIMHAFFFFSFVGVCIVRRAKFLNVFDPQKRRQWNISHRVIIFLQPIPWFCCIIWASRPISGCVGMQATDGAAMLRRCHLHSLQPSRLPRALFFLGSYAKPRALFFFGFLRKVTPLCFNRSDIFFKFDAAEKEMMTANG